MRKIISEIDQSGKISSQEKLSNWFVDKALKNFVFI